MKKTFYLLFASGLLTFYLKANNLKSVTGYTIQTIVHVIHNGGLPGNGDNISAQQVYSQFDVLNADFAGTGLNVNQIPAAFSSLVANTGITFCPAKFDPAGNALAEPGIDRIHGVTEGFIPPPYTNISYINTSIKPGTIWNVTKYCNIWVMDMGNTLTGFTMYPASSGLTGLTGPFGTTANDGLVINYKFFGDMGTVTMPYNSGRVCTHEMGHWLGLLHLNGDSNCGNDDCNDTPSQDVIHTGCIPSSPPYTPDICGAGTSPNGVMTMNFMESTNDSCRYFFTLDQSIRMNTAIANAPARIGPASQPLSNCYLNPQSPVAGFDYPSGLCTNYSNVFTDTSLYYPYNWLWSVNPNTGVTINSPAAQNPFIIFSTPGTYTVTLIISNGMGSDSVSTVVSVSNCLQINHSEIQIKNLHVYPNPASNCFFVEGITELSEIELRNLYGEKIEILHYFDENLQKHKITPLNADAGIYILGVKTENCVINFRLIIF